MAESSGAAGACLYIFDRGFYHHKMSDSVDQQSIDMNTAHQLDHIVLTAPSGTSVDDSCLTGHILVALPHMAQPMFKKTIVLICQHNEDGAVGVIVNHAIEGVKLEHISTDQDVHDESWMQYLTAEKLYWGGPQEVRQGLLVHSPDRMWPSTLTINDQLAVTPYDELGQRGHGSIWPQRFRLFLGHVHWKPGQLEKDWLHQPWISFAQKKEDILDDAPDNQWDLLLRQQELHVDQWLTQRPSAGHHGAHKNTLLA